MSHEFELTGEDMNELLWEASVASAHKKYMKARLSDEALAKAGLDHVRLYAMTGQSNDKIPALHARFLLVPQKRSAMTEGIAQLCVRLPIQSARAVPEQLYRDFVSTVQPREEPDLVPSKDVFVEAIRADGESRNFLMTPTGLRAYTSSADIDDIPDGFEVEEGRLFDVRATIDTSFAQSEADANWPSYGTLQVMLDSYDVIPQETSGYRSSVA